MILLGLILTETIKEVKEQLAALTDLDDHCWATFEEDSRTGVQTAIKQRRKAILAEIAEDERLETMLNYEKLLYAQGVELIAGVDEVGRGPRLDQWLLQLLSCQSFAKSKASMTVKKSQNQNIKPSISR